MKLTVWGARGSIPVSGSKYLKYGGDTTCLEVETERRDTIILDAGSGIRRLGRRAVREKKRVFHFLLTHAHWDHLLGLPFFQPLFRSDSDIYVYGSPRANDSMRSILEQTMRSPFFPVELHEVTARLHFEEELDSEFDVGGLRCRRVPLNHPNGGYGFRLSEGDKSFAFFPDNELAGEHPSGLTREQYAEFVSGVDLLIHDAEFYPKEYESFATGWGHSSLSETVDLAVQGMVGGLLLWHHNQNRSDDQVDEMLLEARRLAREADSDHTTEAAFTGMIKVI